VDENIKNLILAVPVVGVLLYFLNYFMKDNEKERNVNKERDKDNTKIIEGLNEHIRESNKIKYDISKKQDETLVKIDHLIKNIEK
jgi:hypothetical protein